MGARPAALLLTVIRCKRSLEGGTHAPRPHPMQMMQLIGPGTPPMAMSCGSTTPPIASYSHAEMSLHCSFFVAKLVIARVVWKIGSHVVSSRTPLPLHHAGTMRTLRTQCEASQKGGMTWQVHSSLLTRSKRACAMKRTQNFSTTLQFRECVPRSAGRSEITSTNCL